MKLMDAVQSTWTLTLNSLNILFFLIYSDAID